MFHPILEQMHRVWRSAADYVSRVSARRQLTSTQSPRQVRPKLPDFRVSSGRCTICIYEHQKDWKEEFDVRPIFEGYAKQIGLDVERYKRDVNGDAVAQRIFEDGKRGHSLGVKGTPTVF